MDSKTVLIDYEWILGFLTVIMISTVSTVENLAMFYRPFLFGVAFIEILVNV